MHLVQFEDGARKVGIVAGDRLEVLTGVERIRDLALAAHRAGQSLAQAAAARRSGTMADYERLLAERRVLPPLDHHDPAHCLVTGTGLSHLGSAQARADMHAKLAGDDDLTDSMRMFKRGLEGGKPAAGAVGAQPEWFYKGDGTSIVGAGQPLTSPGFALDGGDEAEIVGLYVIADDGTPLRVGFALGNEFSDHVMEKQNYLDLAHSKLRPCAIGPELRTGPLPEHVAGAVRVKRGESVRWSGEFLSGEANMCHSIANLEHHHFRYPLFRRPGDVHLHFFGAGVLSFSTGLKVEPGDVFEIEVAAFGRSLRNPLAIDGAAAPMTVAAL